MHALAAQGSEQKRKACINFTQMNLFSKWYYNGNTLPHSWNLWTSYVILVQCNFSWFFKALFLFITTKNSPNFMQRDWFMYHVRSNKKNMAKIVWSFPVNWIWIDKIFILLGIVLHHHWNHHFGFVSKSIRAMFSKTLKKKKNSCKVYGRY